MADLYVYLLMFCCNCRVPFISLRNISSEGESSFLHVLTRAISMYRVASVAIFDESGPSLLQPAHKSERSV